MYRTSINFHKRIERGEKPIPFVIIDTDLGARGYSERQFSNLWDVDGLIADGTYLADGSQLAGSGLGMLEYSARLEKVSSPTRTISPKKLGLLLGYTQKTQGSLNVTLSNADLYFSKLIAKEPFLTKTLSEYVGFADLPFSESQLIFKGDIENVKLTKNTLVLEVVETSLNTGEFFTLDRASRYTTPKNTNDTLPIVYGDLEDGSTGNWQIPCINTTSFVYCFADHAVLSVGNGNTVSVYADNVLVSSSDYTFSESNDYESEGIISTITFDSDQENNIISVKGSGKDDSGTLIENIIDIIYDFMTVHNSYTASDFDTTKRHRANEVFEAKSYSAAGVIDQDTKLWDLLQDMTASFLGSIYLNAQGLFAIDIESDTTIINTIGIVPQKEIILNSVFQEKISLVNQIPASYAYNYNKSEFSSHANDAAYADIASQDIYGVSEITNYWFSWCRDLTSIQTMQGIITGLYGKPKWQAEIQDLSLKRIHADVGDYLTVSTDEIYDEMGQVFINQFMKIISIKPDIQKQTITFIVVDTGSYMYIAYIADGTYLANGEITAGSTRDTIEY